MKAMVLTDFGGVENFELQELPTPGIDNNEVLVDVAAISINPVDAKTRQGKGQANALKQQHPMVLGWDISGVVKAIGNAVSNFKVGDEVFGMINFPGAGRAYASQVAAPATQLAIKPANISHAEAAAATLAALTAWEALVDFLQVKAGDRLLVHAAAGGVGHFAVQIARHLGAYVLGTASAANKDFVLGLGADEFVDYKAQPLEQVIKNMDKVLDNVGGKKIIDDSLKLLKPGGQIISIPGAGGSPVKEKAAAKGMIGLTMMVQSSGSNQQTLADLLQRGIIKAHVFKTYPFNEIAAAHLQIETARTVGKLIVLV